MIYKYVVLNFDSNAQVLRITFIEDRIESSNEAEIQLSIKNELHNFDEMDSIVKLEFSFTNVMFIDSTGMKMLMHFWKYIAEQYEIPLTFTQCSQKIMNYFELCKINHVISINEQDDVGSPLKG